MNNNKDHKDQQQVPEGYFDSFTDKIMNRVEAEEASFLKNEKLKQLPFQVPENYFNELTAVIDNRLPTQETKVIKLWSTNLIRYAASLIIILSAAFFINQRFKSNSDLDLISQLSDDEVIEYLITDDVMIEEMLAQEEIMDDVLSDLMADVAYDYSEMIDYETEDLFFEQ